MTEPARRARVDVAVIGGGPAGIAAAAAAGSAGRSAVLIDESPRPGGQIWRHQEGDAPAAALPWLGKLRESGARVCAATTVVDIERRPDAFRILMEGQAGGGEWLEAKAVVLATGARERFLPFPGWTLPGVVGIGGVQALLKSGMEVQGRRVVIAGSGPLLLPVAAALVKAGAKLLLVAEQAPRGRVLRFAAGLWRDPVKITQAIEYRLASGRTRYVTDAWPIAALGGGSLEAVEMVVGGRRRTLVCDLLCTGFGLVPNRGLARVLGCDVEDGVVKVDGMQHTTVEGVWCAGEGTGVAGVESSLAEGHIAGYAAAGVPGRAAEWMAARDRARRFGERMQEAFRPRDELREMAQGSTVVCRCEDVCRNALSGEWSARQARLYTRIGMGPCQGRVCGPAAELLFGWNFESDRIPISVATIDTLADAGDD